MPAFTPEEHAILRAVQADLPDSLTPYADIAAMVGVDEGTVLALLKRLKGDGVIRRFGASIKHQRTGWAYNAMVAWQVPEAQADAMGSLAASHPRVSHCYFRPSTAPDWPYTLYTMIHGRDASACGQVVDELRALGLPAAPKASISLSSLRELKKTSMQYF